jgi:hypothetical protein
MGVFGVDTASEQADAFGVGAASGRTGVFGKLPSIRAFDGGGFEIMRRWMRGVEPPSHLS